MSTNRTSIIPAVSRMAYYGGMLIGKTEVERVVDSSFSEEAYEISIKDKIVVKASSDKGFWYAHKTLKQIFAQHDNCIPRMIIQDEPKHSFRSFMIDTGRHYFPVENIKAMIDICSDFKFNYFHWHISEDQGWRLQIDKYPQLTQIGSVRHGTAFGREINDEDYGGFYTKDEVREIVKYAEERFIEVIPELDIPGHTSSILASIPGMNCDGRPVEVKKFQGVFRDVICPGNEDNFKIVFDILDEMTELFPCKYFHVGGDEAPKNDWKKCPKCQAKIKELGLKDEEALQGWFVNRISEYLAQKGRVTISWNESLKGGNLRDDAVVQYWADRDGYTKRDNHPLIYSDFFKYYVDYSYEMTPLKKTYNADEMLTKNVIGVETPIWTEFVPSFERMQYQCFPRFIAVAQAGWSQNKPPYDAFEEDLLKIMREYDTTYWGQPKEWNKPFIVQKIGTATKFIHTLNKQVIKQNMDYRREDKNNK